MLSSPTPSVIFDDSSLGEGAIEVSAYPLSCSTNNTAFGQALTPASLPEGGGADAPEGVGKISESYFSFKLFCLCGYTAKLSNHTPSVRCAASSLGEGAFRVRAYLLGCSIETQRQKAAAATAATAIIP